MLHRLFRPMIQKPVGQPNYRVGPRYDGSGAAMFVFEQEFENPAQVFRGAGRVARQFFSPHQPRPLNYSQSGVIQGIGGLQHGQIFQYPLGSKQG